MFNWLLLLIAYLPWQIALNPPICLEKLGWSFDFDFDLASLRLLIVIFFAFWIIKKRPDFKNLPAVSLSLFLILAGGSLIQAENVFWGLRKIVFFLSVFPLYFLIVGLAKSWLRVNKIIFILIGTSLLVALVGLGQFLASFIFGLDKVYQFWTWQVVPVFSGFNFGSMIMAYPSWLVNVDGQIILRAFSVFSDPHMLSFYLGLILPLTIACFFKISRKLIWLTVFLLLLAVLLLTFSRGAYLALLATFLVMAVLIYKYFSAKRLAGLLILSLLVFFIPGQPIGDRFYASFNPDEGSAAGRLEMWQQAGRTALANPWRGVGLGNYSLSVNSQLDYRNPATAHNFYLDIFSEMGLLALFIWLVLILGTLIQLFKTMKRAGPENKYIYLGLIGSLIYFSAHSFFETAVYQTTILALLMIILGLSTCSRKFLD